jgi:hypothetical protein
MPQDIQFSLEVTVMDGVVLFTAESVARELRKVAEEAMKAAWAAGNPDDARALLLAGNFRAVADGWEHVAGLALARAVEIAAADGPADGPAA